MLKSNLCFALFTSLVISACGPRGDAKDPLPLSPKAGTTTDGYPTGTPSRLGTDKETDTSNPNPQTPGNTPSTDPQTKPSTGLVQTPDTTIPTQLAPLGGNLDAQIASLEAFGTKETLEIGAWNIENYPKAVDSKTVVSKVLNKLDIDIMAVEEINNTAVFEDLLKEMPKFSGVIAGQNGGQKSQNSGVIFRTEEFKLVETQDLFRNQNAAFPRPPLMVRLKPVKDPSSDIVAIVVHLKAFGDEDSVTRREEANVRLEEYTSQLLAKEPSLKIVVLGDFNQPLITSSDRQVFRPWYDKPETYTVKTEVLVKKSDYTFFGGQRFSVIDHIVTSNNFTMQDPVVPKLQTVISSFEDRASDHLPVVAKITK